MEKRKLYLAYGSNLNIDQMISRCPGATLEGIATIPDYRLMFRGSRSGSYLTIEPCAGASVPCGVWALTPADEKSLDFYEGFPSFYKKQTFRVEVKSLAFDREFISDAMAYVMDQSRPIGIPSQLYLQTVGDGYLDFGFDFDPLEDALSYAKRFCNKKEVS